MGRIIQKNNGKTTIFVTGENISSIVPQSNTNVVGVDLNTNMYTRLDSDGEIVSLEPIIFTGGTVNTLSATIISATTYLNLPESTGGGSGGTMEVIDITYDELFLAINTNSLISGNKYRLLDYKSVNFLNGYNMAQNSLSSSDNFNPKEIYVGDNEILLLEAVSENTLSPIAYSETHRGDIIEFQAYTNKIGTGIRLFNGTFINDVEITNLGIQWDGTNAYIQMPEEFPALLGHFYYIYAEFQTPPTLTGGPILELSSIGSVAGLPDGDYMIYNVTSETGYDAVFSVRVAFGGVDVAISLRGDGFFIGDVITILGSNIGGVDGVNDITVTVTNASETIEPYNYYQDGNYEPLMNGVNSSNYPYSNNDIEYDYPKKMSRIEPVDGGAKVLLLDLTEDDVNNYVIDSLYVETVEALGDSYGWVTRRTDTLRNVSVPWDFRARKYRRFEVDLSFIGGPTGFYGIGPNHLGLGTTGRFRDYYTLGVDYEAYNVEWLGIGGPTMYWYAGFSDNNVILRKLTNSTFKDFSNNNTFNEYHYNTSGFQFSNNIITSYYQNNNNTNFFSNQNIF